MQLDVNDKVIDSVDPDQMLLWLLRDGLGLTGTKWGCAIGICGSCTVHVDGIATRACITPVAALAGKKITTIEGLAATATANPTAGVSTTAGAGASAPLHPVQQAWLDEQVPQCGWCQSGQIMTAAAFLKQTPKPSENQVIDAMSRNYCRCGCYTRIKRAVLRAAQLS